MDSSGTRDCQYGVMFDIGDNLIDMVMKGKPISKIRKPTVFEEPSDFNSSRATAFCALRWSPSVTIYLRGVNREKLTADTRVNISLV